MRKSGLITVLVIAALAFAVSFISVDPWLESNIEFQASVANKAKVEIDGFDFDLIGLSLSWDRLQVANPKDTWENTFETGRTEFNMEFWPLLWSKTVIENVQLSGFQIETERDSDGSFEIPGDLEEDSPASAFVASIVDQVSSEASRNASAKITDIRSDINVDSLMATLDLKTPERIDSLKNGLQENYSEWDSTFNNLNVEKQTNEIQNTISKIKIDEIKDPKKAVEAINNIKKLKEQVDSLKNRAQTIRSDFQTDLNSSKYNVGQIDNWISQDYKRAMSLAKLPDLSAQNIGKLLFGENLLGDYASYLVYVAMAREYGSRLTDDGSEKIERYEGINYEFTDKYNWPELWVKRVDLSGTTKTDIVLEGIVSDISSDQKKTGLPTIVDIKGSGRSGDSLSVEGVLNYIEENPKESFNVLYGGFELKDTRISPSELLPYKLNSGQGSVRIGLDIIGKRIDSEIEYNATGVKFDFSQNTGGGRIQQLIRTAISGTDYINATALVDNVNGPLRVRLRTNLDDLFAKALRETVSKEVSEARAKIESEVASRVEGKKKEVLALKEQKEAELRERAAGVQQKVDEQVKALEKKREELEKRKKELEDSLKDKIKGKIGIDF